jgi:hypothetical protein
MKALIPALALVFLPGSGIADLLVRFDEGAPKDHLTITNAGACDTGPATIAFDLSESAGMLIFDTTAAGAGVDVFQPVELVAGETTVESASAVVDGDTRLEIRLSSLGPQISVAFTLDLDDQQASSALGQTRITGSEIRGAFVIVERAGDKVLGEFDNHSRARVPLSACLS